MKLLVLIIFGYGLFTVASFIITFNITRLLGSKVSIIKKIINVINSSHNKRFFNEIKSIASVIIIILVFLFYGIFSGNFTACKYTEHKNK